MENASKALLMAAGVLIGILILSLMATLFISSKSLFNKYDTAKETEAIQQFNVNFTKYIGYKLTVYDVITITNFAKDNGVYVLNAITKIEDISNYLDPVQYYNIEILGFSNEGYVSEIEFSKVR